VISGTSLAAVAATGATAGAVFWSNDCVDSRSALILAATAIITAPLGAKMTHRVDCQVREAGGGGGGEIPPVGQCSLSCATVVAYVGRLEKCRIWMFGTPCPVLGQPDKPSHARRQCRLLLLSLCALDCSCSVYARPWVIGCTWWHLWSPSRQCSLLTSSSKPSRRKHSPQH